MKSMIRSALVLTVVGLLVTLAVAGVNMLTEETIAQNEAKAAQESMRQLLPNAEFKEISFADSESLAAYSAGESGYIFITSDTGYGGEVKVMTAVDPDGKVAGVTVLACDDETPGLGQNCKDPEFTDQFKGQQNEVAFTKDGGDIVAITSATYTSDAVKESVNAALRDYQRAKEAGK